VGGIATHRRVTDFLKIHRHAQGISGRAAEANIVLPLLRTMIKEVSGTMAAKT